MIEVWFTSDLHLGHKNILVYEKEARPFETVEEMNETLISNWNNTVRTSDIVFCLGDFAFGRSNVDLAARLNGRKRLVMGNHDV
ncbi:metallophosphoesterase, partial [Mangrovimonas sp. AS39]